MIRVRFVGSYRKTFQKLMNEESELFDDVVLSIERFRKNPKDTRLKVHPLKKRMEGKWAFSVTGEVRVVFEWLGVNTGRFLAIGGHEKVYRRKR